MNLLFAHQNFPGQYYHLARHLGRAGNHRVVFITQRADAQIDGVRKVVYAPPRAVTPTMHHYLRETEAGGLNAQKGGGIALALKPERFVPGVMLGHNAWGGTWYLRAVFPPSPPLGYFPDFYQAQGRDHGL